MRAAGRLGMAAAVGCGLVGLWAALLGARPVLEWQPGWYWWPGALLSLPVGALAFMLLQGIPGGNAADGVALWAGGGAAALAVMVAVAWGREFGLPSGLAAMELFMLALAGLWWAARSAPAALTAPEPGLPAMPSVAGPSGQGGPEREYIWTAAPEGAGYEPAEPYTVRLHISPEQVEAQRAASHDLPAHQTAGYVALTPEIGALARQLRSISERQRLQRLDEVRLALSFVSEGLGPLDPQGPDGPAYPLEALAGEVRGRTGRIVLAAAILAALGYQVALLTSGDAVALAVGGAYLLPDLFLRVGGAPALYAEVTPDGPFCGDAPPLVRTSRVHLLPVKLPGLG